jgi:pyridoxal phosphate enzyme (YggS family)
VTLLAVSKTRSAQEIRAAHGAGLSRFGENYLQEALDKVSQLADLAIEWHFIGPLQANKTRAAAEHMHWVHSIDRDRIAERLAAQRPAGLPLLNVCIQVHLGDEATKSGCAEADLPGLAATIMRLPRLALRGLMAIPPPAATFDEQRVHFARLAYLLRQLRAAYPAYPHLDTLSMGMSDDLEAAIVEGATIVRVGTALFGPRPAKSP